MLRLYLKKKLGKLFTYERIRVVNVIPVENLTKFTGGYYQNDDQIRKIEEASNIARSFSQTNYLENHKNNFSTKSESDAFRSANSINNLIDQTKKSSVNAQTKKLTPSRIASYVPTQTAINAANTVADTASHTNTAKNSNLSAVLVPGNEPIPISNSPNVSAKVNSSGITPAQTIPTSSSLAVDANLAMVPTDNIVKDKSINIAPNKSNASLTNKITTTAKDWATKTGNALSSFADKTEEVITEAGTKIKDFFTGDSNQPKSSVVPVSNNLSVMSPLAPSQASQSISNPTVMPNTNTSQSSIKSIDNKLSRNTPQSSINSLDYKSSRNTYTPTQSYNSFSTTQSYNGTNASNHTLTRPTLSKSNENSQKYQDLSKNISLQNPDSEYEFKK